MAPKLLGEALGRGLVRERVGIEAEHRTSLEVAGVLLACALLTACGPAASVPVDAGTSDAAVSDAGVADAGALDAGVFDAGAPDAGAFDAGAPDAGPPGLDGGVPDGGGGAGVTLRDGGFVSGVIAARYDHRRWWWNPSNRTTWALLDARRFAPWPDDRSFQFLDSSDLATEPTPANLPDPAVYDFVRDAGLVFAQSPLDGVSFIITGNDGYHLDEDGYGDFAWDFVKLGVDGGRFRGLGLSNTDYEIWNAPVTLPTAGLVIEVENGAPDNTPGGYDAGATNNLVGVHLGGGASLYLLHFRQGSIPTVDAGCEPSLPGVRCVEPGRLLPAGTYLGRVGNSGVSLEPHLHTTVLFFGPDAGRGWSVPSGFSNQYVTRVDAGPAVLREFVVPGAGDLMSGRPF